MNNKSENLEIFQQNIPFDIQYQKMNYSNHQYESNHEAILRLCDNILFMSEDRIIPDKIALAHDCKD